MENNKTPVSVITGFLGAGKTTLLNQLLTNQSGKKYAIIVNEFGEIGIDNDLVVGADEEIFELNNGCVCCNVRGDLIRILGALFKRKSAFDAILIETTGLAKPAPVAQTFVADDDIATVSYTHLDVYKRQMLYHLAQLIGGILIFQFVRSFYTLKR